MAGVQGILRMLQVARDIPLILYNGSVVVRHKSLDVLLHRYIPSGALQRVLSVTKRLPVRTYAYVFAQQSENDFRMIGDAERVLGWSRDGWPQFEFNGASVEWQTSYVVKDEVDSSAILIEAVSDPEALAPIPQLLSDMKGITATRSGARFVEIRPGGSNKGVALALAANTIGLKRESILAVGDSDNDVEMLSWAGIGVAIAGASKAALDASDYSCRHGVAEGAVEVLRLVKHARRYFFQPSQES